MPWANIEDRRAYDRAYYAKKYARPRPLSAKQKARAAGEKYYKRERPCKHGHTSLFFSSTGGCIDCHKSSSRSAMNKWRQLDPEGTKAKTLSWRAANKDKVIAIDGKRRAKKLLRMPRWANKAAIDSVYKESAKLTRETGIEHNVDHVLPLLGKKVSGLHVFDNLQILTRKDNIRKSNVFEPI